MTDTTNDATQQQQQQQYERVLGIRYTTDIKQQQQQQWRVGCGTALSRHTPLFVHRQQPPQSSTTVYDNNNNNNNNDTMVKSWVALHSSDDAVRASVEAKYPAAALLSSLVPNGE